MSSSVLEPTLGTVPITTDTITDSSEICVGQVKWFDKVKGFGFISHLDNQIDYFVHHTQIKASLNDGNQRELFRYLVAGEYVQFKLQEVTPADGHSGQRVMACHVTGIRDGNLMYNVIHQQHQERHAFHRDKYGEEDEEEQADTGTESAAGAGEDSSMNDVDEDGFTQVRRKARR